MNHNNINGNGFGKIIKIFNMDESDERLNF